MGVNLSSLHITNQKIRGKMAFAWTSASFLRLLMARFATASLYLIPKGVHMWYTRTWKSAHPQTHIKIPQTDLSSLSKLSPTLPHRNYHLRRPMVAGISTTTFFGWNPFVRPKPNSVTTLTYLFSLPIRPLHHAALQSRRGLKTTVWFVVRDDELNSQIETPKDDEEEEEILKRTTAASVAERQGRKKSERLTYLVAAVMSSLGITSMAVMAVYYRFSWQMAV